MNVHEALEYFECLDVSSEDDLSDDEDFIIFTSNLKKDNVVPVNTFPAIINWQFAFLLLHHMPIP